MQKTVSVSEVDSDSEMEEDKEDEGVIGSVVVGEGDKEVETEEEIVGFKDADVDID